MTKDSHKALDNKSPKSLCKGRSTTHTKRMKRRIEFLTKDSHKALDKDSPNGLSRGGLLHMKKTKRRTEFCD